MIRTILRRSFAAAALVAVLGGTAHAQKMGSTNRNAPTVEQSITHGTTTTKLTYSAITWAGGQWAAALADEASREPMRQQINRSAERAPLGTFVLAAAMTVGTTKVEAGTWKVAFTLDDKYAWQVSLVGEASTVVVPLTLEEAKEDQKRLILGLRPGEKDGTSELAIAFGKWRCKLPIAAAQ